MITFSNVAPDFGQPITFVLEAFGLMVDHVGREFIKVVNGQGDRVFLRRTLVTHETETASTPDGMTLDVNVLTMEFSYFLAAGQTGDQKPLIHLMPQAAQDRFFGRDGSNDARHHMDDAVNLGLDFHLTNAMLADAQTAQNDPDQLPDGGGSNLPALPDPLGSVLN